MVRRKGGEGSGEGVTDTGEVGGEESGIGIGDYRYPDKRKNNPPAKIASEGRVPRVEPIRYGYSPRKDPRLRFDDTGAADRLPELLEIARQRALTADEAAVLAEALRTHEPWLEWAGKREARGFEVDPVALNIHERVSAQAIVKVAARQDVTRDLFADPVQEYREAVQFYQHDIDWTNRLILGDSLQVMASLAHREDLAGKVQMIYIDPPYGIKFGSNFQPELGKHDVSDKEADMIREPEMVKAYRDIWRLGVHSYLSYLRDRLIVGLDLLADTGSIFVQIGDENVDRVRALMDEVFGSANRIALMVVQKTGGQSGDTLASVADYCLWYAKARDCFKYRQLYYEKLPGEGHGSGARYNLVTDSGEHFQWTAMVSNRPPGSFPVNYEGAVWRPSGGYWKTGETGFARLIAADRIGTGTKTLRYRRFLNDFPAYQISNIWTDVAGSANKVYVVQTAPAVVQRCMLMTTDPGDLVLDPTCGSGTTAYVAEQWGRRWITIDTSRVAISIARQRLLTAKFDFYAVKGAEPPVEGRSLGIDPHPGFVYKTVPHVTLKSIAQNTNLDPIFAKHEPILDTCLAACNAALAAAPDALRTGLRMKLAAKEKAEGKRSITDEDRRRWLLPPGNRDPKVKLTVDAGFSGWYHWEVPFDTDPDYPPALVEAITAYRATWRAKMDEVNACIAANATQEELVDQPQVRRKVVRVSGPFTVEAVQPPEVSLDDAAGGGPSGLFDGEPDDLGETFAAGVGGDGCGDGAVAATNAGAYLERMLRLLRMDGVRFPDNKEMRFTRLEALTGTGNPIHAEGRWYPAGEADPDRDGPATVGVVFGPQYGSVTAKMVEEVIRPAGRVYDDLVIAGFSFDGPAQAAIEEGHPRLRIHMAHVRPDVNPAMDGLLKEQPGSQLFSVFGQPRTRVEGPDRAGEYRVFMEGVDIYNPVTNEISPSRADKVAAWFIDADYDGRTFCMTQAFFPNRTAWGKLAWALKTVVDEERFAALSGTESLPFPPGAHRRVAVKVIDPRGNEVMRVHRLEASDAE